jgi:hypothetical protein
LPEKQIANPSLTLKHKTKDVITLFKSSSPASQRVQTLLKQASANATETATEDQASDHSAQTNPSRKEFDLDVTEEPPTEDQLKNILEYVGVGKIGSIVKGAKDEAGALKSFKLNREAFQRPVVSDSEWMRGEGKRLM